MFKITPRLLVQVVALFGFLLPDLTGSAAEKSVPLEPSDAVKSLVVAPGVRVELVACEPEVIDPVSIRSCQLEIWQNLGSGLDL